MNLTEAEAIASDLMVTHGLTADGWTFEVDRATSRLGLCQYDIKVISLGSAFVESAGKADVRDILLHEIAHALVGPFVVTPTGKVVRDRRGRITKTGHGWQWRLKARSIGYTGAREGHNPAASAREHARFDAARARSAEVAGVTSGPLQLGELVQTRGRKYQGVLVAIAPVNGTIQKERFGEAWRISLANLHRSNSVGDCRRVGSRCDGGCVLVSVRH